MVSKQEFLLKIESHKGIVFKIAKMYGNSPEDVHDIYQEIMYQAWKSFASFKGQSQFSTWLYRVALNTAMTFINKAQKSVITSKDGYIEISEVSEVVTTDVNETDEQLALLYRAIDQLNAIDKALIFYYLEGFTGEEMAIELGISQVNARVRLNRAKDKLKTFINNQQIA